MRISRVFAAALFCVGALLVGCGGQSSGGSAATSAAAPASVAVATPEAGKEAPLSGDIVKGGAEKQTPITADKIADGTYPIQVDSSSSMFRIIGAQLDVKDGQMTCTMVLSGDGYGKLFMGTADEAAAASEDACAMPVDTEEGQYLLIDENGVYQEIPAGKKAYTVPVEALDADTACAAYSIRKDAWYDRTLVFQSAWLPEGAVKK